MSPRVKKVLGILILISGIALFGMSVYIKQRVEEGKIQVGSAQNSVNQGNRILSLDPTAQAIGKKALTDPIQKKIDAGSEQIAEYERMANMFQVGGIALFVVGTGLLFLSRRKD